MNVTVAILVIMLVLVIGEVIGVKTKAFIPSVFVSAILFLIGFWTIFPKDLIPTVGFTGNIITITMLFLVVHMGTLFNIRDIVSQWRTVVISLLGITGMCLFTLTIGRLIFGWDIAIVATPPLTGGIVASLIMSEAANAKGLPNLAVLSLLVYVMQGFLGYPLTAIALKKEGRDLLKKYRESGEKIEIKDDESQDAPPRFPIFKPLNEKYKTTYMLLLKLSVIAVISYYIQTFTGGRVSQYVVALLLGILFAEIGFIERKPLVISQSFGLFMTMLMAFIFNGLAQATPELISVILLPLAGIIIIGVFGLTVFSMFFGKMLGYSLPMSLALSLTALYGFPPSYVLTDEAVKALTDDDNERKYLMSNMLPKMLIGGFTTVTIASVVVAGIFVNLL